MEFFKLVEQQLAGCASRRGHEERGVKRAVRQGCGTSERNRRTAVAVSGRGAHRIWHCDAGVATKTAGKRIGRKIARDGPCVMQVEGVTGYGAVRKTQGSRHGRHAGAVARDQQVRGNRREAPEMIKQQPFGGVQSGTGDDVQRAALERLLDGLAAGEVGNAEGIGHAEGFDFRWIGGARVRRRARAPAR